MARCVRLLVSVLALAGWVGGSSVGQQAMAQSDGAGSPQLQRRDDNVATLRARARLLLPITWILHSARPMMCSHI